LEEWGVGHGKRTGGGGHKGKQGKESFSRRSKKAKNHKGGGQKIPAVGKQKMGGEKGKKTLVFSRKGQRGTGCKKKLYP